jgi:hypothetical protein
LAGFRFLQKGSIYYLESAVLVECDFLVHAFCTRWEGVSGAGFSSLNFSARTGDDPERVKANWGLVCNAFGISSGQFLTVHQVHGEGVHVVAGSVCQIPRSETFPPEAELSCDAMITDRPEIALGIKTADCVPIFLVDRVRCIIGAVHAGWRGTALGIAGKVVDTLRERFSSRPEDILAVIGPTIGPCCYEVDDTVFRAMPSPHGGESFFRPGRREGHWMLDLTAANRQQIEEKGVPPENIFSAGICSSCREDLFYSHRRDGGRTGRHLNFIMLRG